MRFDLLAILQLCRNFQNSDINVLQGLVQN